jgi:phosphatidylglycerol:prolipoprotein diacylglycerol transferase
MAAGCLVIRWRGIPRALFFDCATAGLAAGAFWCRLGCFLAGCCWGRPTQSFVGLEFPFDHSGMLALPPGEGWKLLPTQLYLASVALVILCIAVVARRRRPRPRPGSVFALAASTYALATFLIEFLRDDPGRRFLAGLSHNQWISLAILVAPLVSILVRRWRSLPRAARAGG